MPHQLEIQKQIDEQKHLAQDFIRREYMRDLSNHTHRDLIVYASAFSAAKTGMSGNDLSIVNDDIEGFMLAVHGLEGDELDLILHSPGGSLEATEQIVNYLRRKYKHIRAIIPQSAMSAATMLACATDEIVMGKHSALGPIDPQMMFGNFPAPAQSILDEFIQAKDEVSENPNLAPLWVTRMTQYPPGFFNICQMAINRSKELVGDWLKTYMLKDKPNKDSISTEIAEWLGDTNLHKSHGRPIGINELKQHGMRVTALEDDQELQDKVLSVFHAIQITFSLTYCVKCVENPERGKYTVDRPSLVQ